MRERLAKVHQRGDDGASHGDRLRGPAGTRVRNGRRRTLLDSTDYLKFVRMILNRGKGSAGQVLKPETVDLMSRNHMGELRVSPS